MKEEINQIELNKMLMETKLFDRIDFIKSIIIFKQQNKKLQSQIDEVKEYIKTNSFISSNNTNSRLAKPTLDIDIILSKLELIVPIIAKSDVSEEVGK